MPRNWPLRADTSVVSFKRRPEEVASHTRERRSGMNDGVGRNRRTRRKSRGSVYQWEERIEDGRPTQLSTIGRHWCGREYAPTRMILIGRTLGLRQAPRNRRSARRESNVAPPCKSLHRVGSSKNLTESESCLINLECTLYVHARLEAWFADG